MNIQLQCNSDTKYPELVQTLQVEGIVLHQTTSFQTPATKLQSSQATWIFDQLVTNLVVLTGHSVRFQGKPFSITVIQVYAPTSDTEEAEVEQFCEELQDLLELTPKKRYPFHYRGLECKSRKSRNTWSNRQIWPWSTKWSGTKANRVLPRERTGHSKHPLPTLEQKTLHMYITRWSVPKLDWLYSLQPKMEMYTVSKNKTGSWLCLKSWTPYCQIQTEIEESREDH